MATPSRAHDEALLALELRALDEDLAREMARGFRDAALRPHLK